MLEILDLPVHPVLVHMPIVLVPLLALLMVVYLAIPPVRRHIGWAVMILAVVVPVVVYATRWSGAQLRDFELAKGADSELKNLINVHDGYSKVLFWLSVVLLPLTLLFGALERGRRTALARHRESLPPAPAAGSDGDTMNLSAPSRSDDDPASRGRTVVMIVLGLVMLGLVGVSTWYLFQAGHSGALMVWPAG